MAASGRAAKIFGVTVPQVYLARNVNKLASDVGAKAQAAEQALAGRAVEPADPRAREYTHLTRTDDQGRFTVNGIPAGEFYVSGSVVDPASGERRIVIRQVSLGNGQRLEVNLSR